MTLLRGIFLGCMLALFAQCNTAWHLESIGNVRYTHYYYEGEQLQGILTVSDEGVFAFLDHKTGNIKWRDYPLAGRKLHRVICEGRCKQNLMK